MAFIKRIVPTVLTMAVGLITIVLYFLPGLPALMGPQFSQLPRLRTYWLEMAVIIAAFAMLLGVFNLLAVHGRRIVRRQGGGFFSLVSIVAAVSVIAVSCVEVGWAWLQPGPKSMTVYAQGISGPTMSAVYKFGLYPLQASFAALLAFLLALAAYRTLRLRRGWVPLVFLLGALAVLAAQALFWLPGVPSLRDWFVGVWATAGLRGVLLGVGLGTLATLARVLIGFDRPVSE